MRAEGHAHRGESRAKNVDEIHRVVTNWNRYYDGYDPLFTWWAKDPYKKLDDALTKYSKTIRETSRRIQVEPGRGHVGANDGPIIGDPIGVEGLEADLEHEMIPYTPRGADRDRRARVRVQPERGEEGGARDGTSATTGRRRWRR